MAAIPEPAGAVACGHPVTAQAACDVLLDGGNAYDAVIAAQLVACVVEPVLASLGGGGFLLAHAVGEKPTVYDFFVQTPRVRSAAASELLPIEADFGTTTQAFHVGPAAIATPGMVKGLFAIYADLASLPMTRLVEPALRSAREGVPVSAFQAYLFNVVAPIYRLSEATARTYGATTEGALLKQPLLGDVLEALIREGEALFYTGELARGITNLCAQQGGHLSMADLASYRVYHRTPLVLSYRNARILTNPAPSSGGTLIGFALQLLNDIDLANVTFGSLEHLELLIDVMELTNEARMSIGTGDTSPLDAGLLKQYRTRISNRPRAHRGTTHISIADSAGNIAAMTLSNGEGCGYLIPGSGIMLNNMPGEEDINPQGPDRWSTDLRMTSMMAPTLIELEQNHTTVLGSGGSNRIRTAILQVISNLLDFAIPADEAVRLPRIHYERDKLSLEPGFSNQVVTELEKRVVTIDRWASPNLFFGGVHLVERRGAKFVAVGDARRGGVGAVI
ncbi:MAG: Gamma-glutamyltranspeptidase [Gammaproteobacteria bacterium]|nr:MAG: Gamma-glutamyltranspeptidase [Gammaproteobacteria bacterium]